MGALPVQELAGYYLGEKLVLVQASFKQCAANNMALLSLMEDVK